MGGKDYYDDYDRLAENILHRYPEIKDREDFENAGFDYLQPSSMSDEDKPKFIRKAYDSIQRNPNISPKRKKEIAKTYTKKESYQVQAGKKVKGKKYLAPEYVAVTKKKKGQPKGKTKVYKYIYLAKVKNKKVFARRVKAKNGRFMYFSKEGKHAGAIQKIKPKKSKSKKRR